MPPLVFLDDNILDPISKKGQENVYAQLEDLLASLEPELEKGFKPCYSIEAFFERLGKKGGFWDGFDIYKNTAIPKKTIEDGEAIAAAVDTIQKQLETNIRNEPFFSKNNLKSLYDAAKAEFIGNQLSGDLLNLTFYRYGDHLFFLMSITGLISSPISFGIVWLLSPWRGLNRMGCRACQMQRLIRRGNRLKNFTII